MIQGGNTREERVENVKIESVSLTFISFFITVKGNGFGVTLGGYTIGHGFLGADPQDFEACGEERVKINIKYKTKGSMINIFRNWHNADICDGCIDKIRKAAREKRESERNADID